MLYPLSCAFACSLAGRDLTTKGLAAVRMEQLRVDGVGFHGCRDRLVIARERRWHSDISWFRGVLPGIRILARNQCNGLQGVDVADTGQGIPRESAATRVAHLSAMRAQVQRRVDDRRLERFGVTKRGSVADGPVEVGRAAPTPASPRGRVGIPRRSVRGRPRSLPCIQRAQNATPPTRCS